MLSALFTRCRDVVKVLWCHSHLVWLVLRVPSLHAHSENVLGLVPVACFFVFVVEMLSEKRGGRGGQGEEDAWSVKYKSIESCYSQRTNSCRKFKCFQVKL